MTTIASSTLPDSPAIEIEPLKLGRVTISNRLVVGTGKYESYEIMRPALDQSGAEVVTVAVRRERFSMPFPTSTRRSGVCCWPMTAHFTPPRP